MLERAFFTMDEAAHRLGMSRRSLTTLLKTHPHCIWGGKAKLFDETHLALLRKAVEEKTSLRTGSRLADIYDDGFTLATSEAGEDHEAVQQHNQRHFSEIDGQTGHVYFIGSAGKVKVGRATILSRRIKELQTSSARQLVVLGAIKGDGRVERQIHNDLANIHFRGEWFDLEPLTLDYIRIVCTEPQNIYSKIKEL